MAGPIARLWSAWQRFWFEPQETSSLALFRIAFGLVATAWTATLIPDLFAFYGAHGVLPDNTAHGLGQWGVLALSNNPVLLLALFAATLFSALALTVGLFTRVAAVVVWLGILSLQHRNLLVGNAGDLVVRDLAFFCTLAPAGAALSIDRIRKAPGRFWQFPLRAPWASRLIQIQISVGYLSAVWHKAQNELWTQGTAVAYALRLDDVHRLPTPDFVTQSLIVTNILTYGTLLLELALAVLIWNRKARPWVLVAGVSLHLGIDSSILVGFFSYAMLASYLCFVPPHTATRFILACRDAVIRWMIRASSARRAFLPSGLGRGRSHTAGVPEPGRP